jgi:hypothetical protein
MYEENFEDEIREYSEEENRVFIISRMRTHKRNVLKGVILGLIVTLIVAGFPLVMWFTESPAYPTIFSLEWWTQNETGSVILGTIIVVLITALPVLPVIYVYRYIRADIIDYRRLKKIFADEYGMRSS